MASSRGTVGDFVTPFVLEKLFLIIHVSVELAGSYYGMLLQVLESLSRTWYLPQIN